MARMSRTRLPIAVVAVALVALAVPRPLLAGQPPQPATLQNQEPSRQAADDHPMHPLHEIDDAMVRLPLAALLGTALALRPRRKGTPTRQPAVVQTQIVLAVVGAIVMLVVG